MLICRRDTTALSHIVGLGQSNEQGAQSEPVVSGAELGEGALMFDLGIQTRSEACAPANPELRDPTEFGVTSLAPGGRELWAGEPPAIGMIGQLLAVLNASAEAKHGKPQFLYTYPHRGGKHLAELDWRDFETHPANPNPGPGGYHATFIDDLWRARAAAAAVGKGYLVIAFHLTQGENEGLGYLLPGGPLLTHTAFVPAYRADLLNAYVRWDMDARAISGQDHPVPLFISQVDNYWAGQAQTELANACPEIFLVGPIYYVPSALNSLWNGTLRGHRAHLSADGQRWRGEQAGKVMARVLYENEAWRPLQPRDIRRASPTAIVLRFDVPRPPLAFETGWLPKAPDYGFEVHRGTQDVPGPRCLIDTVEITGSSEVTIQLDSRTPLPSGVAGFVQYGQALTVGVTPGPVLEIRPGGQYVHGADATELVFAGDLRAVFDPLLVEGCFLLRQLTTSEPAADVSPPCAAAVLSASIVIRDMRRDRGTTIVRGETRSIEGTLGLGDLCGIERDRPFGNLRDSDSAPAKFTFADPSYGTRFGQPYPLQNFCVVFTAAVD